MFTRRFTLLRLFGFDIRLDLSWLVLAVLLTWTLARGVFPFFIPDLSEEDYLWMGVGGVVGLLVSIVFHELAHAVVARRYGLPIEGVTLFIFGGVAEMTEEPQDSKTEFWMALAGPVASMFIALVFFLFASRAQADTDVVNAVRGVLLYLGTLNAMLAVFNLLPAYPLDGGRMLRAALWSWTGDFRRATRIAASIGSGFGIALILLGVLAFLTGNFIGGMWWALLGLFLRAAAGMSYQQIMIRQAIKGEPVRKFMNPHPITVAPDLTLAQLVNNFIYRHHHKVYPVVHDGRLVGLIGTEQVKAVPNTDWESKTVGEVMEAVTADNTIGPDADALDAWHRMNRTGHSRLLIEDHGQLVGFLGLRDLLHFLSAKFDLEHARA
jgi:Zn-dependent protease/CBS domain-containing protein